MEETLTKTMSHNPDESPKSEASIANPARVHSELTWLRALTIVAWLTVGAPVGWALATLLWHAGWLNPCYDCVSTFLVMVGPMILTAVFGARKNPVALPRLVLFPLLLAGPLWFLAPAPSMSPRGVSRLYVDEYYPFLVVPATILGGVIAVVSVKLRARK